MNDLQITPILTIVDGALLLLLVISSLMAMARGFTREVTGFCAFGVAVMGSAFLARPLSPLLGIFDFKPLANKISIPVASIATYAMGVLLFIILWVLAWWIGENIARRIQSVPAISALDRILGLLYGFARGLLVAVVVFLGYTSWIGRNDYAPILANARLLPALEASANIVMLLVPIDMRHYFRQQQNRIKLPDITNNIPIIPPNISEIMRDADFKK